MIDPRRWLVTVLALVVSGGCSSSAGSPEPGAAPQARPADVVESTAAREAPAADTAGVAGATVPPFTESQAGRGLEVFRTVCAECHYRSDFRGSQFRFDWRRRTVGDLYGIVVETMPEEDPGGLDPQQYADVVAFILSLNGFEAGEDELVADEEALRAYSLAGLEGRRPE
jgi:mono/diheme cytochrome c family protein